MNSPEATIILKAADGAWTTIGTEASRGIVPEGLSCSSNEFGPDTCSFSLRREASVLWPDLLAFNQADILIGGTLVWGGRIWEAPLSDGDEDVIAVQGRGWQYHLDDDLLRRTYVHTTPGDWKSSRDFATQNLSLFTSIGSVDSNGGVVNLRWTNGQPVSTGAAVGVTMDFGDQPPQRAVITYATSADDASLGMVVRCHDIEDVQGAFTLSVYSDAVALTSLTTLGRNGTIAGTFGTRRRYVSIFMYYSGGSGVFASDWWIRLLRVQMFRSTAYESGNASILKASQVFTDVLGSGSLPLLDSSTTNIGTTAFSIPELAPSGYQTPRALMAAANAFEGNLFGVDAERKVFLRERGDYPDVEVGSWPGASFQDASTNSGEGLYNRVFVQGTGPAGDPISVARYVSDSPGAASGLVDTGFVTNPGFETNTTGWTANLGGSIVRVSSAGAQEGTFAGAIKSVINKPQSEAQTTIAGLTVGRIYAAVIYQKSPVGVWIDGVSTWYARIFNGSALVAETTATTAATSFRQHSLSFVAPATSVTLQIGGYSPSSDIAADIAGGLTLSSYIDAVRIYDVRVGLVSRQGFMRSAVLNVESATTANGAAQLGDIWLNERVNPPLKGSLVVSQGGARLLNGGEVHPSEMLLRYGQLIRLGQLVDPTTGDQGRDGIIKAVSYAHDTETATLELDSERGRLETLLSRLAVVTSQIR